MSVKLILFNEGYSGDWVLIIEPPLGYHQSGGTVHIKG